VAQNIHRFADRAGQRRDIFELPLNGVVWRVSALAASATIHGIHGKVRVEMRQHQIPLRMIGVRAVNQQQWRAAAGLFVGDGCLVG